MYLIWRFYQDDRPRELVTTVETLAEAQTHCRREDTHGDGWFDGYEDIGEFTERWSRWSQVFDPDRF